MTDIPPDMFIETASYQLKKKGQSAPGDVFLSQKSMSGGRIISALSDGLGSGVKANVLASLTATMLSKFVLMDIPPGQAAEIIINSLPVCSERGLAYATFTLVDARHDMSARIIEYENPPILILRNGEALSLKKERVPIKRRKKDTGPQNETLFISKLEAIPGDRIVFFSDGVTQAGMGGSAYPRGWGNQNAQNHIITAVRSNPSISAGALAQALVQAADYNDTDGPKDDISCAVVYFRKPRDLLVITGPPFRPESDQEYVRFFSEFPGRKIISGGTTAQIIARGLGKTIIGETTAASGEQPPAAKMEGADLVCEGILTLGRVAEELSANVWQTAQSGGRSPSARIRELLLDSDRITFLVGTKINEVHQDPSMPVELEIRRNVVKHIASLLEEKYMKAVRIQYI
ncbi:MAG: SpoIIE family protein phosphatase [Termitinemataceae bacterium]|nr:MAG: SpoIIE family protein phosphatase [Termitinemataceae bacterium]